MRNEVTGEMLERLRKAAKAYQDEAEHCAHLLRDYQGLNAFLGQTEMDMLTGLQGEDGERLRCSVLIDTQRRQELLATVRGWRTAVARNIARAVDRWEADSE